MPETILLAALMLAAQPADAPTPPPEDEIVVLGERMRRLKLATKTDRKSGVTSCVFKRRSGDPAFDTLICDALLACSKTVTTRPQMEACISPHIEAYARQLQRARADKS
jgi:hypothetical protein